MDIMSEQHIQSEDLFRFRQRQADSLIRGGIISKLLPKLVAIDQGSNLETLPYVLGSRSQDALALFIGLDKTSSGSHTRLIPAGFRLSRDLIRSAEPFSESDFTLIEGLFCELELYKIDILLSLNLETGKINE